MVNRPQPLSADPEEILDDAVYRRKALQMGGGLEAAHLPLALSGRLMRHFGAVVRIAVRAVGDRWHHPSVRGRIAPQLIRNQAARETALPLQQLPEEPDGRVPIPSRLDQNVEEVTVLVHRSPQVLLATVEGDNTSSRYHVSPRRRAAAGAVSHTRARTYDTTVESSHR